MIRGYGSQFVGMRVTHHNWKTQVGVSRHGGVAVSPVQAMSGGLVSQAVQHFDN